jgi:hypothetical protein
MFLLMKVMQELMAALQDRHNDGVYTQGGYAEEVCRAAQGCPRVI